MTTIAAPSMLARLDAALLHTQHADAALAEQNRIESEEGANPGGWADVDDARMEAGDECADVLASLRPLLVALDAFAAPMGDRDCIDSLGRSICCEEADALARVFLATGRDDLARNLIESHGMADDDVDDVHRHINAASGPRATQTRDTIRLAAEYVAALTR